MPDPGFSELSQKHERPSPPANELLPNSTERQKQILSALGSINDLSQRLYGHLKAQYLEEHPPTSAQEKGYLAGELAEILAMQELLRFSLTVDGVELSVKQTESDQRTNERLLAVLHNPSILHLEAKTGRNPDIAFVNTKSGTIEAVGDVKIGQTLDLRSFKQLVSDGFEKTIRQTVNFLNRRPRFGKEVFGVDKKGNPVKGRISDSFFEIVFLPSDTDINKENWDNLIRQNKTGQIQDRRDLSEGQASLLKHLLATGKVKLVTFSFSRTEIGELTNKLADKIRELEKTEYSQKEYHPESVQLPGDKAQNR